MTRNVALGAVFAVLVIIVGVLLYLNLATSPRPGREPSLPSGAPGPRPSGSVRGGGTPAPGGSSPAPGPSAAASVPGRGTCVLYFQGADVGLLFPEERPIDPSADANTRARLVLEELARGPKKDLLPTLPSGTWIREVYFDASGVAYVDFSREVRDNHPGGSAEELLTVFSVVDSLARNVSQVKAVQFLIEGRTTPTLAGHVDLTSPVRPSDAYLAEGR